MPATPYHDTAVVDKPWDGGANEARLSNDAGRATYEQLYAWRDPSKDQDTKAAYKLPHHEVDSGGKVGAANVNGVRAALSALGGARGGSVPVPASDVGAVKSHLQKHLDKFNAQNKGDTEQPGKKEEPGGKAAELAAELGVRAAVRVQIDARVWAIHPRVLAALCELDGQLIVAQTMLAAQAQKRPPAAANGSVAVLPLHGVLMPPGGGLFAMLFGGTPLDSFRSNLGAAAADDDVSAIVLDVDSPGGVVDHIPETAAQIRAARAVKPVVAIANTQADSAAYWLAAQADEVVVTPSGEVGSIGCYQLHRDTSEAHAMRGIAPTLISAGKYKVEGNPYEPLGEEARASIQADVNDYYSMFVADVARGRGVAQGDVRAGYGEGRALHAKQAVQSGLADRVESLGETVRRVLHPRGRAALDERRAALTFDPEAVDLEPAAVTYTPEERSRLLAVLAN